MSRRASAQRAPWTIWLLVVSFLCPTELSLYLGGLRLPPHRVALILLLLPALWRFMRDRRIKLHLFDVVFFLYNAWTVGVFLHHLGQAEGLPFGGSLALESFAAYVVARAYVVDYDTFQGTLKVLVGAIFVTGAIALPEAVSGKHYVHEWLGALTGYHHPIGHETRLGLTRAYGTFDHPIHLGTFCASIIAMVWFATERLKQRRKRAAILAASTVMGLSSAPMLCFGLQAGLITWDRVTRGMVSRLTITLVGLVGLYIGASLVSTRSPIAFIATGMTLDSWTGYYRLVIWEHGLENVWANPWTGLGLGDWTRPWWMVSASVDAFWLLIAMRAGIPAIALLALAIGLLVKGVWKRARRADPRIRRSAMGWTMSLIALSLVACTVHFWNVLYAYFFFFLGLAGWICEAPRFVRAAATARAGGPAPRPRMARPMMPPALPAPALVGVAGPFAPAPGLAYAPSDR